MPLLRAVRWGCILPEAAPVTPRAPRLPQPFRNPPRAGNIHGPESRFSGPFRWRVNTSSEKFPLTTGVRNSISTMHADLTASAHIGFILAHRAHLTRILVAVTIALVITCFTAAQFSGRQPATVALDVGISVIRLLLPVLSVFLLQELIYREFDRKYYLLSLTYPQTRFAFLLGRVFAVLACSLLALSVLSAALWLTVNIIGQGYTQSRPPNLGSLYAITMLFLIIDVMITVALGALIACIASSISFVLIGTLGFVLCARSFSPIIDLLNRDNTLVAHSDTYQSSLSLLGYVLPDLARLDVRLISLYDTAAFLPKDWPTLILTTAAYALALFSFSAWLFNRRQFS